MDKHEAEFRRINGKLKLRFGNTGKKYPSLCPKCKGQLIAIVSGTVDRRFKIQDGKITDHIVDDIDLFWETITFDCEQCAFSFTADNIGGIAEDNNSWYDNSDEDYVDPDDESEDSETSWDDNSDDDIGVDDDDDDDM